MNRTAVILFLRVPEKGKVKTRLARGLGDDFALSVYKGFVLDILDVLSECRDLFLFYWPSDREKLLHEWLGKQYEFLPQTTGDIGQKMSDAFSAVFSLGYDNALLLGTDIPEFDRGVLCKAFDALESCDCVIGPSTDGGYYLIGFSKQGFSENFFNGIDWSTHKVLDQTISCVERESVGFALLDELEDIDFIENFDRLLKRMESGKKVGKNTYENLIEYANGSFNHHTGP